MAILIHNHSGMVGRAWPFFFGAGLIMLANGLQTTVIALRANFEGFATSETGMVMTGFFLGMLAGSILAPRIVRMSGHIRAFAAFASLASASVLTHTLIVEPYSWTAIRFITGFCYAGMFIVTESWLNQQATVRNRGRLLGLYTLTMFGGAGIGHQFVNLGDPTSFNLFLIASIVVSLALIPLLIAARPTPRPSTRNPMPMRDLYAASPLGFMALILAGVSHGALFGMGAVYAREAGLAVAQVAWFMSLSMIGSLVSQWPIGWLSDRFDRRRVMLGVALAAAIAPAAMLLPFVELGGPWFFLAIFFFGAAALPLYSLSVSHVNDYLSPKQMVAGSATIVLLSGFGLILGPLFASAFMERMGPPGYLQFMVVLHLALAGFIVYRMTQRAAKRFDEQVAYVPVGTRGTASMVALAAQEAHADDHPADEPYMPPLGEPAVATSEVGVAAPVAGDEPVAAVAINPGTTSSVEVEAPAAGPEDITSAEVDIPVLVAAAPAPASEEHQNEPELPEAPDLQTAGSRS